ncbi:MAG: hypothetical protein JXA51_00820 [Dehalococcoidales bacterium]|nr:hypothetical protein [Dehalococcoidales bacterium]
MKISSTIGKSKMKYLLATLVAFVILDGLLTELLLDGGMAREGNPFLQPLVGDAGFMVLKVAGSLLCAFILWDIYKRFPRVAAIAAWIAVVGYAIIVAWNSSLFLLT